MQFYRTLIAVLSVMAVTGASPTARVNIGTAQIDLGECRLDPWESHQSNFYSSVGCPSNGYITSVYNFGCGGHCYDFDQGIQSVYLEYGGGSTKPTASCYTSRGCSGEHQSIGIAKGNKNSCTTMNKVRYSCEFYYGC